MGSIFVGFQTRKGAEQRYLLSLAFKCFTVTFVVLLQFVPIVPFKLQKLSEAMYLDDKEEAMTKFRDLLGFLPPEMVRPLIAIFS